MTGRDFLFEQSKNDKGYGRYLTDYQVALDIDDLPSLYHVEDTWENYDKLAVRIDRRYATWQRNRVAASLWKTCQ